ncbi:MAG TPA: 16S rRNA (guanine(527)-N(7))-methyltransferase RsmG [Candidatus Binatia bacterium]|nr:16S rRNA (guanine(527)-N(7))-methyltransferase RsmG [Candidatus Binatia bacterium]
MTSSARASPEARLLSGLLALKLDTALAAPLLRYLGELVLWSKAYNLTAVRDPAEIVTRHLLDSLVLLPHLREDPLLDAGSGAGLPAVPLAIARPQLRVTALDSSAKKCRFLRQVKRVLKLDNLEVAEERAEAHRPAAPYGQVVSRAFAALGGFLASTGPLGAPQGQWLAMKGKLAAAELKDLPAGFRIVDTPRLQVPGLAEERHLILVSRVPA